MVDEVSKSLTTCCPKSGMASCLLAACRSASIMAANEGQDGDMQPQPSQRNSYVVSYIHSAEIRPDA